MVFFAKEFISSHLGLKRRWELALMGVGTVEVEILAWCWVEILAAWRWPADEDMSLPIFVDLLSLFSTPKINKSDMKW